MIVLRGAAATDVGRVRTVNQDGALVATHFFAVADGMGGHRGGEVASSLALRTLESAGSGHWFGSVDEVVRAVDAANETIFASAGRDPELRGMGTTLCALALLTNEVGASQLVVANVGDSRAYRLARGELVQLTVDHSLVQMLVDDGQLSAEDAERHPNRNILTRALGIEPNVVVDTWVHEPRPGDRFLVCSDGLFNEVPVPEIAAVLAAETDPSQAAEALVARANLGGGRDNITCVVVDVIDDGGDALSTAAATATALFGSGPIATGPVMAASRGEAPARTATVPILDPTVDATTVGQLSGLGEPVPAISRPAPLPATPTRRRPRLTGRLVVFVLALAAVLAAGAVAVGWYANRTFFVALDQGEVVIFKGRPGGLLWLNPSVAARPDRPVLGADLTELQCERVLDQPSFAGKEEAQDFVDTLREELAKASTTTVRKGGASAVQTPTPTACR